MRTLILATSVALALGSAPAIAQSGLARVTTANTSTPASASTTQTTVPSSVAEPRASAAASPSTGGSSSVAGGSPNAFGTNTTTSAPTNSQPAFGPGGSFSNDSGNTALGTSPGQTSSGTAAGNSSTGIGAGSATLDPANTGSLGAGPAVTNPDGTVPGTTVNAVGERVPMAASNGAAASGQQAPTFSIINTPTFDQAAREGRAREQARKARGIEPRVYGIAPRTENDLTWQMPDDRIIRY